MKPEEQHKAHRKKYYLDHRDEWHEKYYLPNREKKIAQSRNWRIANTNRSNELKKLSYHRHLDKSREQARKRAKQFSENHPGRRAEATKRWRLNHPEKARESNRAHLKKRYAANPELRKALGRKWRLENPEKYHEQNRVGKHRRRVREISAPSIPFTKSQWLAKVESYGGRCAYCDTGVYEHMDHVVALSRGGEHSLSNVVPACKSCNLKKGVQIWTPRGPQL